ncbi:DNA topoisomerase IB [Microlunatus soli]|uniref:DNA topoisomerase n=1 Tax=Microlunatus soli TaxID=630515 RepID=A0A1H1NBP7_9ACTN|nr:DNA topoisomerase IB [Microlunatus soli]SDR96328.1 DNA topoisomerase IB [Microlunatus soli]
MRLRRSDPSQPGWTRRRRGAGFSYHRPDGSRIAAGEAERVRGLAIPPAWQEVWICPWDNGHLQAEGTDAAGRRQYLYHPDWRRRRDTEKHARAIELATMLPRIRRSIEEQLDGHGWPRQRTLAVALRMLDHGVFRTGGEEYLEQNGSYGVATLLRSQVRVNGSMLSFSYTAKGGIDRTMSLRDPALAHAVTRLRRIRSDTDRLLVYRSRGAVHQLRSADLNERFQELAGEQFSVKDLRTWSATVLAAVELAKADPPRSLRASRAIERSVLDDVADHLGNTPTTARKSYVDPRLFDFFERGETIAAGPQRPGPIDESDATVRDRAERSVLRLLQG